MAAGLTTPTPNPVLIPISSGHFDSIQPASVSCICASGCLHIDLGRKLNCPLQRLPSVETTLRFCSLSNKVCLCKSVSYPRSAEQKSLLMVQPTLVAMHIIVGSVMHKSHSDQGNKSEHRKVSAYMRCRQALLLAGDSYIACMTPEWWSHMHPEKDPSVQHSCTHSRFHSRSSLLLDGYRLGRDHAHATCGLHDNSLLDPGARPRLLQQQQPSCMHATAPCNHTGPPTRKT